MRQQPGDYLLPQWFSHSDRAGRKILYCLHFIGSKSNTFGNIERAKLHARRLQPPDINADRVSVSSISQCFTQDNDQPLYFRLILRRLPVYLLGDNRLLRCGSCRLF
jgi:hypothetical protein